MTNIREYRILEKIGEGGMGTVYKAMDTSLDRLVALKAIHHGLTSNEEIVNRFKQEARVQAALLHPNIVALHNFFKEGEGYYMAMEYVEGETLTQRIRRVGLIPPSRAIPIFTQMLSAVGFAHSRGIVHRDIKPSNIMVDAQDQVKVMDFGIAKVIGDKGLTKTGAKVGTIYYMSPEQVMASKDIDSRSDIFSLGITLFEMLTGKIPYDAATDSEFMVMQQIVRNDIPSVKSFYPFVPDRLDKAISISTKKDPEMRFSRCEDVIEYMQNVGDVMPASVPPELPQPIPAKISVYPEKVPVRDGDGLLIFNKAALGQRLAASILDGLLFGLGWVVVIAIASASSSYGPAIIFGLPLILLMLLRHGFREGKGICKGVNSLRIINANEGKILTKGLGFGRAFLELFFGCIPYVNIIIVIIDVIFVFSDDRGRRVVDRMLGTQVVNEEDIIIEASLVRPR